MEVASFESAALMRDAITGVARALNDLFISSERENQKGKNELSREPWIFTRSTIFFSTAGRNRIRR